MGIGSAAELFETAQNVLIEKTGISQAGTINRKVKEVIVPPLARLFHLLVIITKLISMPN